MKNIEADQIIANSILLKDKEGKLRLMLSVEPDNSPMIRLMGSHGHEMITIFLNSDDHPGVAFYQPGTNGVPKMTLSFDRNGQTEVQFWNKEGKMYHSIIEPFTK